MSSVPWGTGLDTCPLCQIMAFLVSFLYLYHQWIFHIHEKDCLSVRSKFWQPFFLFLLRRPLKVSVVYPKLVPWGSYIHKFMKNVTYSHLWHASLQSYPLLSHLHWTGVDYISFEDIRGCGEWGDNWESHTLLCVPYPSVMSKSGKPWLSWLPRNLSFQMIPSNPRSVEIWLPPYPFAG